MESPKIDENSIPKTIDRYEIQDRIGAGGMGLIVKAFDTRLKREVAIKMISDKVRDEGVRKTIRERFFNEARAAGGLSHPNIVQIYDFGETDGLVYIVMEYIQGETLEQAIKSRGKLSVDDLLRLSKEMASALSFAHRKAIVHRDIKPSNVIIEANTGVSKILDFGIAKFIDEEEMKLTSTGMVLGSTHYLSPEHITGRNLDGRSDIFCLGTLLYEASTGSLPFRGTNSSTILYKIVHFDPPPVSEIVKGISPDFSKLVQTCLQKKNTDRFQKCEDIVSEILRIERSFSNQSGGGQANSHQISLAQQRYFLRDVQLMTSLVTQAKLTAEEASRYKGNTAYQNLLQDGVLTEDEICQSISESLQIPWISKGRLRSIRIDSEAFHLIPADNLRRSNLIPFFLDKEKRSLSLVIDGITDFQADAEIAELARDYQLQVYIGSRPTIQRLIQQKIQSVEVDNQGKGILSTTGDLFDETKLIDKRVLLIEPKENYQQAIIKLSSESEKNLTIVSTSEEALKRIRKEKFNYVWANSSIIGDELAFEAAILKKNPSAEIRVYENLGEELFEDSIHYHKFREFFVRLLQNFLKQGNSEQRRLSQTFGSLAVKVARSLTQNQRELDEVYFCALLYKWQKIRPDSKNLVDVFDGIYRLRHCFDCITERFDGRGPMGLKAESIPVSSRILSAVSIFDRINPNFEDWSIEQVGKLKEVYQTAAGKHLDPIVTSQILELIKPVEAVTGKTTKVAIVDSDHEYSQQLLSHLKGIHAEATIYPDGLSALSGMKKNLPDLIISEVLVSKLDGFALAARIRADEILKKIPFIFVSESQRSEHSTKAIQLGAEDFISKTSEPQFIVAKIEKLLKNKA